MPIIELFLNPFAGPAGFNLIAAMVWLTVLAGVASIVTNRKGN